MDSIKKLELTDKNTYPDNKVLQKILGHAYIVYSNLMELFDKNKMTHEWKYYSDGKAWLCKVQKNKRTIIWMSAWKGFIKATIYLPQKYLENLYKLDISKELIQKIKSTKDAAKSKPCIFEIKNKKIIKDFNKVMNLKLECK